GLFLATLTGPGKIWLQSMPIMNLAEEIGRYLPLGNGERGGGSMLRTGAGAAVVGGILGSMIGES
ncbi:MAG: TIGR00266 family protein, partial [Pseudomonadota bacterium]|nr:TIGR00266 family protein [Pseudomonadota bacterium]